MAATDITGISTVLYTTSLLETTVTSSQTSSELPVTVSLQMVIEGVRGSGIEGDIAIDDVAIEEGECKDPPPNSEYALDEKLLFDSWLLQTHTQFLSETSRTCFEYFLFLSSVNMKDAQSLRTIASFLNLSLFH